MLATVVLNKEDYSQKMNNILKDARYKQMKSNPTTKVEKKVADALKEAKSRGGLSSAQRKSLANNYSTPPQLYGLPKIHKNGTPFRLFVSSTDLPAGQTSCQHSTTSSQNHILLCQRLWGLRHKVESN